MDHSQDGWIGIDESGKGDYFGPLVVSGAYITPAQAEELLLLGIKDSKRLTDLRVQALAQSVSSKVVTSTVAIGPKRYNELYAKIRNLNRLLAWAHARVLENILERVDCSRALSDQFGDEHYILNALLDKGKKIRLEQRPRAEDDPAVATASVLARAEFLRKLKKLSQEVGMTLPKGASDQVIAVARELTRRHGPEVLKNVAKYHFKTTQAAISGGRLGGN